jgi:hypothetical protein
MGAMASARMVVRALSGQDSVAPGMSSRDNRCGQVIVVNKTDGASLVSVESH